MLVRSGNGYFGSWHQLGYQFTGRIDLMIQLITRPPGLVRVQIGMGESGTEQPFYEVAYGEGNIKRTIKVEFVAPPTDTRVAIRISANGDDVKITYSYEQTEVIAELRRC